MGVHPYNEGSVDNPIAAWYSARKELFTSEDGGVAYDVSFWAEREQEAD